MHDRLATELWEGVFDHLREDKESLKTLNLTDQRFHALSRPRLFTDFTFHPYCTGGYGMSIEDLYLPLNPTPERLHERLEFWASEEIAPLVRECVIEPLEFEAPRRKRPEGEDPYTLLNAFFALLPRFVNLQGINAFTIHFTNASLATLSLLPKLTKVGVEMCSMVEDERPQPLSSPLKLTTFTFGNNEDQEEWWYRALSPDTLQKLGLDLSQLQWQYLFSEPPLPTFPNVHTFYLAVGRAMGPHHFRHLAKFPGIRNLHLARCIVFPGFAPNLDDLGDIKFCPVLENYKGPVALLPFLTLDTVKNLNIDPCEFDDFVGTMRRVWKPNNLVTLEITFCHLLTSLTDLAELLPELEILRVIMHRRNFPVEDDAGTATTFWGNLPSTHLPPKLIKLAIDMELTQPAEAPDLPKVKDALFAARPTLKTLWIHSPYYAYACSVMPHGEQSVVAGGEDFAASALRNFDILFYGTWIGPQPDGRVLAGGPLDPVVCEFI
ncbi:hypothetical protein B0H16DRAFT_1492211 [Mycena metata]|uniref:Uncharacterized protein n=1 Tax=Mycena metata TaxID=1033252 RepID=A0AAD7P1W8_9AGAR|nr:hypothetical protein B0H16DRAFT_1492211 [Mycena metata]